MSNTSNDRSKMTALITGASSGIGLELAKLFAKDGYSLLLIARRSERLTQIANELKERNPNIEVHILAIDLSETNAVSKVFEFTQSKKISIDFLVNNAGFGTGGAFDSSALDRQLEMIDLNMRALLELTHRFLTNMKAKKFGRILNVGSVAGFQPGPYMTTYYATKAFVNSFSEALAFELKNSGITCTLLAPGPTKTEFAQAAEIEGKNLFHLLGVASAESVSHKAYNAMMSGRVLCIPGIQNKLLVFSIRFTPRFAVRWIASIINQ